MMKNHVKNEAWVSAEQLNTEPEFQKLSESEFNSPVLDTIANVAEKGLVSGRRDFLKYLGFGLGAATVAASCDIPVKKAIPYVVKPDKIVPGVATYYASSFVSGGDYCSIIVKTREGRPIKIEGNSFSKVTKGATSARAQASVLSLYNNHRLRGPGKIENALVTQMTWAEVDAEIGKVLKPESRIRIISNTILSPTTKRAIGEFTAKFPNARSVIYDPVSSSAMLQANQECFGESAIPDYHFDKASVIVSFGADFLGSWISPVEYAGQYAKNRKLARVEKAQMSRHIQVESHMSLTGSNADNRILIRPSEQGAAIATLYNEVAALAGGSSISTPKVNEKAAAALKKVANELFKNKGTTLVVSDSNNIGEQVLVNAINNLLGNYGSTLNFTQASMQRQGLDANIQTLINEMNGGAVDAVFCIGDANPAFDLPNSDKFLTGLQKVGLRVFFGGTMNETGAACQYAVPTHHFLESWGDAEPKRGIYSLVQPTIAPLFDSRQTEETLLRWCGSANFNTTTDQPYFEYLKANWQASMFPQQTKFGSFQSFWDSVLHDGVFEVAAASKQAPFQGDVNAASAKINKPSSSEFEIAFFETVNIGSGQYADNPWLQEMPDPVSRCTWGNYLSIPLIWEGSGKIKSFKGLNEKEIYREADQVEVEVKGQKQRLTCVKQFGLAPGTFSIALGYGREVAGPAGQKVGKNVFPWLGIDANGNTQYYVTDCAISGKVGKEAEFACVQLHHTMGVSDTDASTKQKINVDEKSLMTLGDGPQGSLTKRSIIRQTNLSELKTFVDELHQERKHFEHLNEQTLYPYEQYKKDIYSQGHHWGMHVDLNGCVGCGACVVACIAENNVPVVGKHEVWRHHEMTWLRIDRYFYGDFENPNVVYQPMMCQHCDNAPCENVCPVVATNHSDEGLNQMAYNRCIGTRYCANNCPYKVRRFNWLDYTSADLFPANEVDMNQNREGISEKYYYMTDNLTRMVLNPDVTVRTRGVMEKCSFCVQRIQEGKLTAKQEGRKLNDADVRTACQTACPTSAITFGDMNDKGGILHEKISSPLVYEVLEEVNTRSSVKYSIKVTNRLESLES